MLNTQLLVTNTLQDLIYLGITVFVPVAIHYVLTKVSKDKLAHYTTTAAIAVKATQQALDINEVGFKEAAAQKLSTLVKGKLSADVISHLIDAAMTDVVSVAQSSLATENAADVATVNTPVVPLSTAPTK